MKAMLPVFSKKQMDAAHKKLQMEYAKVANEERKNVTRRIFKVMACALYEQFGFGKKRIAKVVRVMTEMLENSHNDGVFWEHVDKLVVDYLDIPFERDYTVKGQPYSESELEKKKQKGGHKP